MNQDSRSTDAQPPIEEWRRNLPMSLTWARMALAPVILLISYFPSFWTSIAMTVLFVIGSITDWLDGYWARKWKVESDIGRFMDPVADKVLTSTVLILLIPTGLIGPLPVILFLCRDIIVGGVRATAATKNIIIAAGPMGKWKAAIQMVAIPALLLAPAFPSVPFHEIGWILLWIAVILSTISGWDYTMGYRKKVQLTK